MDTLYDKTVEKLKNNVAVAVILLLAAGVVGLAQFSDALSTLRGIFSPPSTMVIARISILRYDFMVGESGSPKYLKAVSAKMTDLQHIADTIAREVVAEIGPPPDAFSATLTLNGSVLTASRALRVSILAMSGPQQTAPQDRDLGEVTTLDLRTIFDDPAVVNPHDHSVRLSLGDRAGYFSSQYLQVFKRGETSSLDADRDTSTRTLEFTPRVPAILLTRLDTTEARLRGPSDSLTDLLREGLERTHQFKLLDPKMTLPDLERRRQDFQRVATGPFKEQAIDDFRADYIISGNLRQN